VDLADLYGKAEIIEALGTADPKIARQRLPLKWAELDRQFERARLSLAASADITKRLSRTQAPLRTTSKATDATSEAQWAYMEENAQFWAEQAAKDDFERDVVEDEEQRILALAKASPEGLSPEQRAIRYILRDKDYFRQVAEEHLAIARSELKRVQAELKAVREGGAKPSEPAPAVSGGHTLEDLVDKWAAERRVSAKGKEDHQAIVRWFKERVGDLSVEAITKRDVLTFKDKLVLEGATLANVKVKLSRLRTLLNYAASNDLIPANPASDVRVVLTDSDRTKRKPFDLSALTSIFSSPVYSRDERPTEGRGEAAYWLPLLGLYTGARLEELGQLRPSDVQNETYPDADEVSQSAWLIHVVEDDEDDLKLKNSMSERVIPVHPVLEQLGFIRFVAAAKSAGQQRLFPELRPNKYNRLTAKWGEWFGDYKRNVVGITDRRLVFHSFRHSFKDFGRGRLTDGVQRQIMGHSGGDVADSYGSGFPLWKLVEGMANYRGPGFAPPQPPPSLR
jgi:integrase